jgi:hypothetical protein
MPDPAEESQKHNLSKIRPHGLNADQAPLPMGPALIELAAAAIAHLVLNGPGQFKPKELISHTQGRCMRMLKDVVIEYDKARRAHLRLVK